MENGVSGPKSRYGMWEWVGPVFFVEPSPKTSLFSRVGGQPVAAAEFYRIGVLIGWVFRAWGGSTLTPLESKEVCYPLHHQEMPIIGLKNNWRGLKHNWRVFRPSSDELNETHLAIRRKGSHDDDQKAKLNTHNSEIDVGEGPTQKTPTPPPTGCHWELSHFFLTPARKRNSIVRDTTYYATQMPVWAPLPKK